MSGLSEEAALMLRIRSEAASCFSTSKRRDTKVLYSLRNAFKGSNYLMQEITRTPWIIYGTLAVAGDATVQSDVWLGMHIFPRCDIGMA
jgi:hypothetical protein